MNKDFLFATSSGKIKSHAVESLSFTSAASKAFAEASLLFSICHRKKKYAEPIKFFRISKRYISNNIFCLKKTSNVSLNKKVIFLFHTSTVLSTYACILFSYFFYSLISVPEKQNIETMLTLPFSYN